MLPHLLPAAGSGVGRGTAVTFSCPYPVKVKEMQMSSWGLEQMMNETLCDLEPLSLSAFWACFPICKMDTLTPAWLSSWSCLSNEPGSRHRSVSREAAPRRVRRSLRTSPFLHEGRTVGLPRGRVHAAGVGPAQDWAAPGRGTPCPPLSAQPCKLPGLNSTHTSVEGELFARYTVSVRRVSYEPVFKYVTGSINRDLL